MNKDNIIDHFKSGIKEHINTKIGVEHENSFSIRRIIKELIILQLKRFSKFYMNLVGDHHMKVRML